MIEEAQEQSGTTDRRPMWGVTETLVRRSLLLACPFNLVAAFVFAFPSSTVGQQFGLPQNVSPLYGSLVSLFVGLFGSDLRLVGAPVDDHRPVLALGGVGKLGAFVVALALWLHGEVVSAVALVALGDLAFATLWLGWLLSR